MAKYLMLGTMTKPEMDVRDLLAQGEFIGKFCQEQGIKVEGWPTMGAYDYVVIVDVENDVQIQNTILMAKKAFGQRTTVVRLFDAEETAQFVTFEQTPSFG